MLQSWFETVTGTNANALGFEPGNLESWALESGYTAQRTRNPTKIGILSPSSIEK